MSDDRVLTGLSNGILTVTLHRPHKRNAMDTAMVDALLAQLDEADLSTAIRVIALRGAGKDFCGGADLAELLASVDNMPQENAASAAHLGEVFVRMRRLPKPVVAVVHGRALAGGCGLATACDLVVARPDAVFGYPEVQRGFVPAMVMAMLRRAVGEKTAFDLVATGRLLTAEAARDLGLVARVFGTERFEEEVDGFLLQLVGASASALALIKRQLYDLDGRSFEDGIALGAEVNAVARSTPDFKDAVAKFLER
jgi:methylglutaconyl-CoA hydratase